MSARVIPISPEPDPEATDWQSLEVVPPPKLPRIPPGDYQAVSKGCKRYELFSRMVLRVDFDVYDGDAMAGAVLLARLPHYMRWMKRPTSTSKLANFLHVAGLKASGRRPVSLNQLANKLWTVRVVDAAHDSTGKPRTAATTYSIIEQVLERL